MRLKFLSFSNLTLLVALALSSVAAWYSIIGLTAIFAGAVIPVIIMGGILEIGKITTTVWLRKYWNRCGFLLKLYLVPAVIALALLTSMGIFGFLSKAHMEQGITSGDVQSKIALYDEKIKTSKENIDVNRKALKQMDEAVDQIMGRSTTETGADKAVAVRRGQQKERGRLLAEIETEQKKITALNEERAPIAAEVRKVEAEVGPIKYIAALIYGDNADTNMLEASVRWVIILLVIVFDPLAIALVLAANASKEWDEEEPKYEQDDGPLTDEQINQVKETVERPDNITWWLQPDPSPPGWVFTRTTYPSTKEELSTGEVNTKSELFPDEPINCYICGTPLINAPGIGPFCPNKSCDVKDDLFEEPEEEPKSILEQHPYLSKPFVSFDTKPMVAPKVETVVDEPTADEDHTMEVKQDLPFKELPGGYVSFDGKHMQRDALFSMHPEFLKLSVDSGKLVNSGFGPKFPDSSVKGDVFTRVDVLPNKVYKYDGKNWIEIAKTSSNTYLYNSKYIEYLIEMIDKGEYDPELLSENERTQIEDYIKIQKNSQNS
jgi:hypothetical protein